MSRIIIPKGSNAFNSHEDITKICSPIFKLLGLTFFRYLRVYQDMTRVHLCTHPEWSDNFYSKELYKIAWFDTPPELFDKNMEYIWDIKATTNDNVVGVEARSQFNFYHGISLIRTSVNYHEVYDFATDIDNLKINEMYMKHMELFERFILYFKEKAKDLIFDGSRARLVFEASQSDLLKIKKKNNDFDESILNNFLDETAVKRLYIDSYNGDTYLTNMGVACAYWTILGKSAEEVSMIFNINRRTVEIHLANVKNKLGISKLTQISTVVSVDTLKQAMLKL